MKARIAEHDDRLELVITTEDYEEHILMRAFLRENATASFVPISTNNNGHWSLTLGTCRCEERAIERKRRCPYAAHADDCTCEGKGGDR